MRYFKFLFFALVVQVLAASCSSAPETNEPEYKPVNLPKETPPAQSGYYCPMKCEGEKVYPDDRNPCPECKMKLVHTK